MAWGLVQETRLLARARRGASAVRTGVGLLGGFASTRVGCRLRCAGLGRCLALCCLILVVVHDRVRLVAGKVDLVLILSGFFYINIP